MRLDREIPTWIVYDRATGAPMRVDARMYDPVLHLSEPPGVHPDEPDPVVVTAPKRVRTRAA
jgi:hypothetical protein